MMVRNTGVFGCICDGSDLRDGWAMGAILLYELCHAGLCVWSKVCSYRETFLSHCEDVSVKELRVGETWSEQILYRELQSVLTRG